MVIISNDKIFFSYLSSFTENEFRKFFHEYRSSSSFLPFIDNEKQFFIYRSKLLGEPISPQSQVTMSAATANIDNEQKHEEQKEPKEPTIKTKKNKKPYEDKLIIHYTHEKRLHDFKQDMYQVYEHVFQNTPVSDVKLIVGNRNRRDAYKELIRKRPNTSICYSADILIISPSMYRKTKTTNHSIQEQCFPQLCQPNFIISIRIITF